MHTLGKISFGNSMATLNLIALAIRHCCFVNRKIIRILPAQVRYLYLLRCSKLCDILLRALLTYFHGGMCYLNIDLWRKYA